MAVLIPASGSFRYNRGVPPPGLSRGDHMIKVYIGETELPIRDFIPISLSKTRDSGVPEFRFRVEGESTIVCRLMSKASDRQLAEATGEGTADLHFPVLDRPTNAALLISEGTQAPVQVDLIFTA